MRKKNVWKSVVEPILRDVFPYPWDDEAPEEDKNWLYYSACDPLLPFLTGENLKKTRKSASEKGIEFVELEGSMYDGMDYDSIPQEIEDPCSAIITINGGFYRVGLIFTSYSGYKLSDVAHEVSPKTVEVVVYE